MDCVMDANMWGKLCVRLSMVRRSRHVCVGDQETMEKHSDD